MKKSIILLFSIALTSALSAQDENKSQMRASFNFQAAQHIGLTQWSNTGYVNDGLPKPFITELRGTLNILDKYFGVFMDMGLGIMPVPKMRTLDLNRMPTPRNGTQYFLRETLQEADRSGASAHFKMTFGLVGKIPTDKENLTIMPYLGVGFLTMPKRTYEVILKENNSNMEYQTTYIWNHNDNEYSNNSTLGYLTGRLNFKYNKILIGLEYTWFFTTIDFYARHTNVYNANITRNFTIEGNRVNTLGLSVGISL
ncbi:MAG: hypothetical protein LBH22_03600 [Bacteroidales bacterium]|jgi:hypothetical protein|nr:hypothetical protein [Bacteroidales bacterium]